MKITYSKIKNVKHKKKKKKSYYFNQNNFDIKKTKSCRANCWIVVPELKVIYMLNAKVMSTSIKSVLGQLQGFKISNKNPHKLPLHYVHIGKILSEKKKYRNYFKFTFVRNPWARLWSCYCQKSRQKIPLHYHFLQFDFRKHITWDAFVNRACEISDNVADMHIRSQSYAIDVISADFIGKQESTDDDWRTLQTHIKDLPDLPHLQPNNFKHDIGSKGHVYKYANKQIEMVAKRYKNDICLFDYDFLN